MNQRDSVRDDVAENVPLFVDLDGTVLKTDSLFECFFAALRTEGPSVSFRSLVALIAGGRGNLKKYLAGVVSFDVESLPLNEDFVNFLRHQHTKGREIWLATAADRSIAEKVAGRLRLFHGVLASDGKVNLKGRRKLDAILETTSGNPFDYAGDGKVDMPIWERARRSIVVNASSSVVRGAESAGNVDRVFAVERFQLRGLLTAMRPYQWVKNTLVFVPMLTTLDPLLAAKWPDVGMAFASFCFIASGTYLLNDLLDLQADRKHPRKRYRPMASGAISIPQAAFSFFVLVLAGLLLAASVTGVFLVVVLTYLVLTITYSTVVKTYVIGDVISLAALYTLRLLGGAAAVNTFPSVWLIGFSMFIFFSLALVKRCAELEMLSLEEQEKSTGRDYRVADVQVLYSLGTSFGAVGVLVFVLYVADPLVASRFATPAVLWLIAVCLIYWLARLWIKTARGEMHDDPIVFTLRDRGTRKLLLIAGGFFLIAAFVDVPQLLTV